MTEEIEGLALISYIIQQNGDHNDQHSEDHNAYSKLFQEVVEADTTFHFHILHNLRHNIRSARASNSSSQSMLSILNTHQ